MARERGSDPYCRRVAKAASLGVLLLLAPACARPTAADLGTCAQDPSADMALAACSRAIDSGRLSSPKLATALYNRGLLHQRLGAFDLAIRDFDQSIALRADKSKAFYNRAIAFHATNRFERAIQDFDRAAELTPDYAPAFRNRGNAYRSLGAFDRAIQDYDRAIALSPEYAVAFSNRGVAYLNQGMHGRAIQDFDQAIRLKPDDGGAYRGRGTAYYDAGDFTRATGDFAKAVELHHADPYAPLHLFMAERRAGLDAADRLRSNAAGLDREQWPGAVISLYLDELTAAQVFDAARRPHPMRERERMVEAHYYVGHGLLAQGQRDQAIAMLQDAVAGGAPGAVAHSSARAELKRLGR